MIEALLVCVNRQARLKLHAQPKGGAPLESLFDPETGEFHLTGNLAFQVLTYDDGEQWLVAYTSDAESRKGDVSPLVIAKDFRWVLETALENGAVAGLILNPYGLQVRINREIAEQLLKIAV